LEKLHLPYKKLLHDWIHLSLLLITAWAIASPLTGQCGLINSWSKPGVHHPSVRNMRFRYLYKQKMARKDKASWSLIMVDLSSSVNQV
jgi:hypothetical protein